MMPLLPFQKVKNGDRVLVYGAGMLGYNIVNYIKTADNIFLSGWTDKRAEFLKNTNPEIDGLDVLFTREYDICVIAIRDRKIAEAAKNELVEKGILVEKIDWVKQEVIDELGYPSWLESGQ